VAYFFVLQLWKTPLPAFGQPVHFLVAVADGAIRIAEGVEKGLYVLPLLILFHEILILRIEQPFLGARR
jgi:hypothetical protein